MSDPLIPKTPETVEVEKLRERLHRAGEEIRKAMRDWHRFQDFIVGEGPREYFRLIDSGKKAEGVIEKFMAYLSSLWNERDALEAENDKLKATSVPNSNVVGALPLPPESSSASVARPESVGEWTVQSPKRLSHYLVMDDETLGPTREIYWLKRAANAHNTVVAQLQEQIRRLQKLSEPVTGEPN